MTVIALVVAALFLAASFIVRAAGASLVRTPRADALHDLAEGDSRAGVIAALLEDRARLQPAIAIFQVLLLAAAAILATWALSRELSGGTLVLALILLVVVLVFLGDLVPRNVGRRRPRRLAYQFAWLLRPAVALGGAAADLLVDVDDDAEAGADHSDAEERKLISSIIDFTDTIVREVMVPRTDMVTLTSAASTEEALDVILAEGKSRVPVVGSSIDEVLGVFYARDLLQMMDSGQPPKLVAELMHPAYFVPETKRVPELMREMQVKQVHLAIVIDEFGGTAGLATIEDLLEEIVGEIADEYDVEEPMVTPLEGGGFLVDGRMGVDELGDLIGVSLPDDEWDTVGGLVLGLAGRVPREGESFELERHVLTAERVQGRRIARVRLDGR